MDRREVTMPAERGPSGTGGTARQAEGWFGPSGSKRFHYFDTHLRSLCGKWMLWQNPEDLGLDWGTAVTYACSGDCAECSRRLAKREAAA